MLTIMKTILVFLPLLAVIFTSIDAYSKEYVPGQYSIDVEHSKIGFMIPYLMISSVEGKFTRLNGLIHLKEKFEDSQITVEVDTSSITTDVEKRDDHLRSSDFFDVEKHPKMIFKSVKIIGPKDHFKLVGDLTIKGITRRVEFDTVYLGVVANGFGNDKAAFLGKAKINRKHYGINWNQIIEAGEVIGDDVDIELKVLASKPSRMNVKLFDNVLEIAK